jgi:hypothetical protein
MGIPPDSNRSDFALEPIPEERRRPQAELWASFEIQRPLILGVLLDAIVEGLRRLPETHLPKLPRMADFALWVTACESSLWPEGSFWSAYCGNRDEAVEGVIDADPIAIGVRSMMAGLPEWKGTAADLLVSLSGAMGERVAKSKTWPDTPRALSGRLRRAATFLRKIGLEINFQRKGQAGHRIIHIAMAQPFAAPETAVKQPSVPSASSAASPNSVRIDVLSGIDPPTVVDEAGDQAGESGRTVSGNPLKAGTAADADGTDANSASQSGAHENSEQTCVQCEAAPDGKERLYTVNGKAVRLHPECKRFYSEGGGNSSPAR